MGTLGEELLKLAMAVRDDLKALADGADGNPLQSPIRAALSKLDNGIIALGEGAWSKPLPGDRWKSGMGLGIMVYAPTAETYVLITNGVCGLDHPHEGGCEIEPLEGMVMGADNKWSLQNIRFWQLRLLGQHKADEVAALYREYLAFIRSQKS